LNQQNQTKTPTDVIEDIIAFLESKGVAKNIIKDFLEEMEDALKDSLAQKIAETIDPEKYLKAKNKLGEDAEPKDILKEIGISDEDINRMLVQILADYKSDLEKILF